MTFPQINHPEEGISIPAPAWTEEVISLLKHQLAAQNQTNQLLQQLVDAQPGHPDAFAEIMERALKRADEARAKRTQDA